MNVNMNQPFGRPEGGNHLRFGVKETQLFCSGVIYKPVTPIYGVVQMIVSLYDVQNCHYTAN